MEKLIVQIAVFVLFVTGAFLGLLCMADGYTDSFYLRFTTPRQQNMIIGTSRAAQGIRPSVLEKVIHRKFFNYAFTLAHSPFGPVYLKSIVKKTDPYQKNGVFIISIDPWSICSKTENPEDTVNFREVDRCVGNTKDVTSDPNIKYLINNLGGKYYKILFGNTDRQLHENGWLEITINMDKKSVEKRKKKKLAYYKKNHVPFFEYSDLRFQYLMNTIQFLSEHGKVYMVRLPVSDEMLAMEKEFMPQFNDRVRSVIPYLDGYYDMTLLPNEFSFIDGNHLFQESGYDVSDMIGKWIIEKEID
jgi:hypothetical protein